MTTEEVKRALKQMGGYSVRLFLDNGTTVLAHEWDFDVEADGWLRVMLRGREAVIVVNRIGMIERVPPP